MPRCKPNSKVLQSFTWLQDQVLKAQPTSKLSHISNRKTWKVSAIVFAPRKCLDTSYALIQDFAQRY